MSRIKTRRSFLSMTARAMPWPNSWPSGRRAGGGPAGVTDPSGSQGRSPVGVGSRVTLPRKTSGARTRCGDGRLSEGGVRSEPAPSVTRWPF